MTSSKKTKVLYLITKSNWGGAQVYVHQFATSLPRDKFEVFAAAGAPQADETGTGRLFEELTKEGIPVITLRHSRRDINPFRELALVKEVYNLVKREQPDVLHVNSSKLGGIGAFAGRLVGTKRIVFTAHGWPFREKHHGPIWKAIIYLLSWTTSILADTTITITDIDYKAGKRFPFCKKKIVKIPLGIKPLSLSPKQKAREALAHYASKRNLKLDTGGTWIGTIAELTPNKGHKYLFRALKLLAGNYKDSDWKMVMIGSGEKQVMLHNLAKRLGIEDRIYMLGFVPNGARHLEAFDIFTLTSLKEGLPYTLLEAGLAKRAVVASRVGGIPDIIDRHGMLVPIKDPKAIKEALALLLDVPSKRTQFGEALSKHVEDTFRFEKMIDSTTALYEIPSSTL